MGVLLASALFGSVARGDDDDLSDVDVLALVQNGAGVVAEEDVVATLPPNVVERAPTVSWYGVERYLAMHRAGELFAWHVFLDAKILHDATGLLAGLGPPARYSRALEDVDAFIQIAADVPAQLEGAACNAIYEMGVLYVCVRNVAMSASALLGDRPDFTRQAPYRLPGPVLRLAEAEYHVSMLCRLAGQRGLKLPNQISAGRVLRYHQQAFDWMLAVRELVDRNLRNG
jgi:hypothetical protein